jgi:hypothetical protein
MILVASSFQLPAPSTTQDALRASQGQLPQTRDSAWTILWQLEAGSWKLYG